MRQFNQMYVNGAFVIPHGKATVDLVNPTNNEVIGKVTLADENRRPPSYRRSQKGPRVIFSDHQTSSLGLPAALA
jgi:hypothetical protein